MTTVEFIAQHFNGRMEYIVFWFAAVLSRIALSAKIPWDDSMETCSFINQQPSMDNNVSMNNTWLGKAKYEGPWGVIVVQIRRIEENETCSAQACGTIQKSCQYCPSPVPINKNTSSFEELRTKLTPGQKYIIRDNWSRGVEGIPRPSSCLVYRGASYTEYFSCNNSFDDGCKESGDHSPLKVFIYLERNKNEGTTTNTPVVTFHEPLGDKNGSTGPRGSLVLALTFFLIH